MKGVIIYKGKYGATQQYAEWLSKELRLPLLSPENLTASNLRLDDFIIIGSSVYMGRLLLKKWLKKNADILQNKKVFFFIVCGTPPTQNEKLEVVAKNNIPAILKHSAIYFFQGKMKSSKLSWMDRFALKMGAMLEKNPVTKKEMLQDFDAVKKENINALVNAVKVFSMVKREAIHSQIL
jgi:menaquinone-dependent protoporphyrinogen IX oxidase